MVDHGLQTTGQFKSRMRFVIFSLALVFGFTIAAPISEAKILAQNSTQYQVRF
jgi:hypothetical protein